MSNRPRIALITNHGYAGVEIPVGGAPDTGGQNFYVNSLALALEENGFNVTIFARGRFPFFGTDRPREGTEQLSEHVRYVYVPGGGDDFIRKEDIATALDEQTLWLARFIEAEAAAEGVVPHEYYKCINTHYWDAAVIAVKLVERWQDQIAFDFLNEAAGGILSSHLDTLEGEEKHRVSLSREIHYHLGAFAAQSVGTHNPAAVMREMLGPFVSIMPAAETGPVNREVEQLVRMGEQLAEELTVSEETLADRFFEADRHVWTPHSLGIIKERNFWNKEPAVARDLKFRERNSHEEFVCSRTQYFCSTSPEIWRGLVSYHGVGAGEVFDFPPCIDGKTFKPRPKSEMSEVYAYLSEHSGIPRETLEHATLIFETSRMDHTKRKDILLKAMAEIAPKHDSVYCFIGGGPNTSEVFKELTDVKASLPALDGRAFLLGFVPEEVLEPLFSAAEIFVSASEMEGFGMSASQAAAAGAAVICSDLIPFATQYASDAAIVVPAGDVQGFAAAIEQLLSNPESRKTRSEQLRKIAGELDWTATAARFVDWFAHQRDED